MRRRPAADEQRVDFARCFQPRQLPFNRPNIRLDQIVATGNDSKIAVAAAVATERNMNVCRAGRRESRVSGHSHKYNRPPNMSGRAVETRLRTWRLL